jgi:hypothetical protein
VDAAAEGFLEPLNSPDPDPDNCGLIIGGRKIKASDVARAIERVSPRPAGNLLWEVQVKGLESSPLLVKANFRPFQVIKCLPAVPSTFEQMKLAAKTVPKSGAPTNSIPAATELNELGFVKSVRHLEQIAKEGRVLSEPEVVDEFFKAVRPEDLSAAMELMRNRIESIGKVLVNELTREDWVMAFAANTNRMDAGSYGKLSSVIQLRTNRLDQLGAFIAATHPGKPPQPREFTSKLVNAGIRLANQRRTDASASPEAFAKPLSHADGDLVPLTEAVSVCARFISGTNSVTQPDFTVLFKAMEAEHRSLAEQSRRKSMPLGAIYKESLNEEELGKLDPALRGFLEGFAEMLNLEWKAAPPELRSFTAMAKAAWHNDSKHVDFDFDLGNPASFKIPGNVPGMAATSGEGFTREMFDRSFRVVMHTRANAQGAARTQFGSQSFALYLEQVAAIAVRKKQYPDQASIEKVARMCLGMPELENVKFFKSSIVPHVLYIRDGTEPSLEFWDVPLAEEKKSAQKLGLPRRYSPPPGQTNKGYPSRNQSQPK